LLALAESALESPRVLVQVGKSLKVTHSCVESRESDSDEEDDSARKKGGRRRNGV
jgi:hypothetical protein